MGEALRHIGVRLNVRQRIVAATAVVLIGTVALLTWAVTSTTQGIMKRDVESSGRQIATAGLATVQSQIGDSMRLAQQLEQTFVALKDSGTTERPVYDAILKETLAAHPDLLGTWTVWEPNALDGADSRFAGTKGTDATGRYIPYWNRAGGAVALEELKEYTTEGIGDYYLLAKKSRTSQVLEPYSYTIEGVDVVMTSVAVPIIDRNNRFLGVVGVDLALSTLQEAIGKIRPHGGYATLVSAGGLVVAAQDPATVTKPASDWLARLSDQARREGTAADAVDDRVLGDSAIAAAAATTVAPDHTWVLAVSMPSSEVLASISQIRGRVLLWGLLATVIAVAVMIVVAAGVVRPLRELQSRLVEIADGDGDLTQRADDRRSDEIGSVAAAFNRFANRVGVALQSVSNCSEQLLDAAADLDRSTSTMSSAASTSDRQAAQATATSTQVSTSVVSVAGAAEQMSLSIQEISVNTDRAARIAGQAVETAQRTGDTVARLDQAGAEIDEIVRTITGIAEQTNLLALNATIEAARAGAAGKGFAVVASEVKELAQQTSRATESIAGKVVGIQQTARDATQALGRISEIVTQVNEMQGTIAAAIEQQTVTTQAMTEEIAAAAQGSRQITATTTELSEAATQVSDAADGTGRSGAAVSRVAQDLRSLLTGFRF